MSDANEAVFLSYARKALWRSECIALFGEVARKHKELVDTLRGMNAEGELAPMQPLPERKL